jgi:hypothetical protein
MLNLRYSIHDKIHQVYMFPIEKYVNRLIIGRFHLKNTTVNATIRASLIENKIREDVQSTT